MPFESEQQQRATRKRRNLVFFADLAAGFILLILDTELYRKTFISPVLCLSIFFFGSLLLFLILRKRVHYLRGRLNEPELLFHLSISAFVFGPALVFGLLGLNYFFANTQTATHVLPIEEKGYLGKDGKSGDRLLTVTYYGYKKELIFSDSARADRARYIRVKISGGFLGFFVIREQSIINQENSMENLLPE